MREWKPARIVEVGSGYSSLLIADVNTRFLGGRVDVTCIEPFPRPFLKTSVRGISRLVEKFVQEVPLTTFTSLGEGDILFIDSSHVSKIGSDVNFLFLRVIPSLKKGVRVHVHDIFLPHEYPREWVLKLGMFWNEQYLLHALLAKSGGAFRVLFGCNYANLKFPEQVADALRRPRGQGFGGGSFWFEIGA